MSDSRPRFISLLYPTEESYTRHQNRANLPRISDTVCEELGLNEIFRLRGRALCDYFTADEDVIRYRQTALTEVIGHPALQETLSRITPILDDIHQLRRMDQDNSAKDAYL